MGQSSLGIWVKYEPAPASQIDTGMMFVNNVGWADTDLPFGGIKNSGGGRELGSMGIQEFVNEKLVRRGRRPELGRACRQLDQAAILRHAAAHLMQASAQRLQ